MNRLGCLAGILAAASGGCASATTLGTARTLDVGAWQFSGDVKAPMPVIEAGVRRGMLSNMDAAVRVGGFYSNPITVFSASLDTKWQLWRSAFADSGWDFAIDPAIGYESSDFAGPTIHSMDVSLPVMIGKNFGAGQLITGVRAIGQVLWDRDSSPTPVFFFGASLGFAWRVKSVVVVPEATFLYSPSHYNTSQFIIGGQGGIGVLFPG